MPLTILIPLVVLGIAGIAILLHLSGLTAPRRFDGVADANAAWLREFPEMPPIETHIDRDNRVAFVRTEQGDGLVWCMGADTVARPLADFDLMDIDGGLEVRFHDFSAPHAVLHLSDLDLPYWKHLLERS
ncbi:hypothetical protein [Shimia sp. SDUM112013]|uniref:hypothetical protein n=1 Tax=Shimia sp. SDUM112013 TaxID=3136160 RepID=UPI0032EE998C